METASEILERLNEVDGRIVQPVVTGHGVRFTMYRLSDLEAIEKWVQIARKCKNELGAEIDTTGVHSEANFRIWVPQDRIEFDVEEGTETVSTGYN